MNNEILSQLSEAIKIILRFSKNDLILASENESQFSVNTSLISSNQELTELVTFFPYLSIIDIFVTGSIEQYSFTYSLNQNKSFICIEWICDNQITPESHSESDFKLIEEFNRDFSDHSKSFDYDGLCDILGKIKKEGLNLSLDIKIQIDKQKIINSLNIPSNFHCLIFLLSSKLEGLLANKYFFDVGKYWGRELIFKRVIFLADASGKATSPWLEIIGFDEWENCINPFLISKNDEEVLQQVINFRKNETYWDFEPTNLNPFSFFIFQNNIQPGNVINLVNNLCLQACLCYLTNRVKIEENILLLEFSAKKRINLIIHPQETYTYDLKQVFSLFRWAYENSNSDKLNIFREVASLSMNVDTIGDINNFLRKCSDILISSKNNYQYYLRNNVSQYFEERQKIIEFIQKFAENTNETISKITTDLVGDLYRTIGILIADLISFFIDPKLTPTIIYWTSLLYFIYICITLLYSLSFSYLKFHISNRTLSEKLIEFSSIFTSEEIETCKTKQYYFSRKIFLFYFAASTILYSILGSFSYLLVIFFE